MADFTVSLGELRKLKKKLEDSETEFEEALRRMKDTGPKNLRKRVLDKACENFEEGWVHKRRNVVDALPKSAQTCAKKALQDELPRVS